MTNHRKRHDPPVKTVTKTRVKTSVVALIVVGSIIALALYVIWQFLLPAEESIEGAGLNLREILKQLGN
ncbi:hypothetical protein HY479_01950 [Candidatus Uhrbacteria bacterium]|nr:hypothetical protein [Candidatus Uhrbacteria bacterium]